jgi:hypothetical protein
MVVSVSVMVISPFMPAIARHSAVDVKPHVFAWMGWEGYA